MSSITQDGLSIEKACRKIELQSPADLTYLVAKASRAARDKIDRHFPPEAAIKGEDRMKAQVETLVEEYIRGTFDLIKPNLSINGMDSRELEAELLKAHGDEAEFEAFDTDLAYRIQDLSREIEEHTVKLAELRRAAPSNTAAKYCEMLKAQEETYKERLQAAEEERLAKAAGTKLSVLKIERLGDVQQTWQENGEHLDRLSSTLPKAISRAEQAQKAQDYIRGG